MASIRSSWVGGVSGASSLQSPVAALSCVTGDTIGVWFNYGVSTDPTSVTDTAGNVYTQRGKVSRAGGFTAFLYACENATGDANLRVTLNIGFTEYPTMAVAVMRDVVTSSVLDVLTTDGVDTAQPWTLSSGTLSQADEIVFGFLGSDSGSSTSTFTEGSGMTKLGEVTDSNLYWTGALAYVVVSATTARTQSWTSSVAGSNSTQIVASFKGAAAAGGITGAGQIASAEASGAPGIGATVALAGIASVQALGTPGIGASVAAVGIASVEAVGQPAVGAGIGSTGIASAQAFGAPVVGAGISAAGIASAEAIGAPVVNGAGIFAAGITSAEAFGQPAVGAGIVAAGISSGEAIGQPTVGTGTQPQQGGGGIEPATRLYRYGKRKKRERERDWLDGPEEEQEATPAPQVAPARQPASTALGEAFMAAQMKMLRAQEVMLIEQAEQHAAAARAQAELEEEEDIAALLLML
jgi:hypothetical protein